MSVQKYWLRIGILGIVALIVWVVSLSTKQLARNERIENEVSVLEQEAEKIRRENETLSEKIQYFSSADFREQEAKEKLGMKKTSEAAVAIKARPDVLVEEEALTERRPAFDTTEMTRLPNYRKWWEVFFGT